MSNTVKVKVSDNHHRTNFSLGDKTVRSEPVEVEVTETVKAGLRNGNLELVEGRLEATQEEKSFQGVDRSGEEDDGDAEADRPESEGNEGEADEKEEEDEEVEEDEEESLEDYTVSELRDMCEENDLKKSGKKAELIERLEENA